ncbi:MAG TPA: lipoate--protein ligase family protein [Nocardioidaceae bacterium]
MDLLRGPLPDGDQALEMALAQAMMRRVARGDAGPMLRVYRPTGRAVAFGRRDVRLAGLDDAVAAVRRAGFEPCVRAPGGRAVAYTSDAVVVDHVSPDPEWPSGLEARFDRFGDLWTGVLQGLGVEARVGEVPGEYCPGSHSVNARGVVKLVGTAQRMVRGAWLFSAVLVVDGAAVLRPLLREVYDALDLPFDEGSVGSLVEEAPGVTLDEAEAAVVAGYAHQFGATPGELPPGLVEEAQALLADHRL